MRVTNKMMSNNFLRDMNNNLENLKNVQEQMTSGKEIRKPSDDPFKVSRAMQVSTDISANVQYNSNIQDTANYLDTADTALDQAGNVLQRVRELLVSSGDAAYGTDEKAAIKNEINQKIGELAQIINTNYDGTYVFGGTRGTTKPLQENMDPTTKNTVLSYNGRNGSPINLSSSATVTDTNEYGMIKAKLSVEISQGVSMDYNVTADDVMRFQNKSGAEINFIDVPASTPPAVATPATTGLFSRIVNHLDGKNDDGSTIDPNAATDLTGRDLADLTDGITNLLKVRSDVGAKANRMDSAQTKNEDENFNLTSLLSKTEDIDITQKTMEFANMQTVYTASLQTSAKIIQPTLMDYLK